MKGELKYSTEQHNWFKVVEVFDAEKQAHLHWVEVMELDATQNEIDFEQRLKNL